MTPGQHIAVVTKHAHEACKGRHLGWELRDTLLVISPGPTSFYVLLFRVPCEESTVAAQMLRTGTGPPEVLLVSTLSFKVSRSVSVGSIG